MNKNDARVITRIDSDLGALPGPVPGLQAHELPLALSDYRVHSHREMEPFGPLLATLLAVVISMLAFMRSVPPVTATLSEGLSVILLGFACLCVAIGIVLRVATVSARARRATVQGVLVRRSEARITPLLVSSP